MSEELVRFFQQEIDNNDFHNGRNFDLLISSALNKLPDNNDISPGYVKDMVNLIENKYDVKYWNMTLYICDDNYYEISLSFLSEGNSKFYIDRYGRFYLTEQKLLFMLPIFCTSYRKHNDIIVNPIPRGYTVLEIFTEGVYTLFRESGSDMFRSCIGVLENKNNDVERYLIKIKFIYLLFNELLISQLPVQFTQMNDTSFTVHMNRRSWKFFFEEDSSSSEESRLENYKRFCNFKKFATNNAITSAFTEKCEIILTRLIEREKIRQHNEQLPSDKDIENFKWNINHKFVEGEDLAFACFEIAEKMLERKVGDRDQLTLAMLKFVIYWIRHKIRLPWNELIKEKKGLPNDEIYGDPSKIHNLLNQFNMLYDAVVNVRENFLRLNVGNFKNGKRFPSFYSAAYHLPVHFNDTKDAVEALDLSECPNPELLTALKGSSSGLEEQQNFESSKEDNVENIAVEKIEACAKFYTCTVPEFLFSESLYSHVLENDPGNSEHRPYWKSHLVDDSGFNLKEYVAGKSLLGLIAFGNISTIHGICIDFSQLYDSYDENDINERYENEDYE